MAFNGGSACNNGYNRHHKIGKPTVLGAITGAVAGLVAVTLAAVFISLSGSIFFGIGAPLISHFAIFYIKEKIPI